jgi:phosphoribosyl 1,2-cyclic phosphate phosphodiesterase
LIAEAIILGSGTSNGVPMLGVPYPPEYLANPKNHRTRASLMLCGPTGNLLVDCAPEMRIQVTREGITEIVAVLITHTHADHVMGMDDLRSICIRTRRPMPVYTLPQYQDDIRRIYSYAFREFPPGVEVPRFQLEDVPEVLEVGGMSVHTFLVQHGTIPVVALRVGGFAYVTDVSAIPAAAEEHLQGLDTLVLDAVRYKPHVNHFHYERALEVIRELRPKMAYLTHLGHDYDHDQTNLELPEGVRLAYDGLRIIVE